MSIQSHNDRGWEAIASLPLAQYQETHQHVKPENVMFLHVPHLSPVNLHLHTLTTEYKYDFAPQAVTHELKTSTPDPEGGLCGVASVITFH